MRFLRRPPTHGPSGIFGIQTIRSNRQTSFLLSSTTREHIQLYSGGSAYDEPATMGKCSANYQPLTPLRFLERAAATFPSHPAVNYGADYVLSYAELYGRSQQLAAAVEDRGVGYGDTVAVLLGNTPQMIEAHYGIPMTVRCSAGEYL
eukprot:SAG31_NODE_14362_length_811_cov_1.214888_1_plen_148_part_00